jgi:hypothetical protein
MYPKSSGTGIVASTMVRDILKMAGLHDVGVKVHGSRNPGNTGEAAPPAPGQPSSSRPPPRPPQPPAPRADGCGKQAQ